jgi:predicted nucleic acid-binding protein
MKYVLDSSAALRWVLPEVHSDKALVLRDEFFKAIHQFLSPDVFAVEIAHALTRAERQNRVTAGQAMSLWADVMSTPPRFFEARPLLPRAIEISSAARIGVYDCLYIALSEMENCELVTADEKLIRNLRQRFP